MAAVNAVTGRDEAVLSEARAKRNQTLASVCRNVASATAEHVGGGVALVFGLAVGEEGRDATCTLRAAAGFAEADAAVTAAESVSDTVRRAVETLQVQEIAPPAGLGEIPRQIGDGLVALPTTIDRV